MPDRLRRDPAGRQRFFDIGPHDAADVFGRQRRVGVLVRNDDLRRLHRDLHLGAALDQGALVGMNVFVIKSVIKDVNMSTIFVGVLPFVVTDLIRLVILILFPLIATWLPQRMVG